MKIKSSFSIKHIELLQERNGIAFNNPECSAIENSFCSQVQSLSRDKIGFWLSEEMANREKVLFVFSLLKNATGYTKRKKMCISCLESLVSDKQSQSKKFASYWCILLFDERDEKKLLCSKIDFKPNIG